MKEHLTLPRLISDGMVIQQGKKVRIWGWDRPGEKLLVFFGGEDYAVTADQEGQWEVFLKPAKPGGPYTMKISNARGEEAVIGNVLIGDVFFCSGQSNMELPMERVKDRYPREIRDCDDDLIRTFKITEHSDFQGPVQDLASGEWKAASADNILAFSATAYFFAREYRRLTGVPVGLINASLGGSLIESWMGRDMLAGCEEALALADRYKDKAFVESRLALNLRQTQRWQQELDEKDTGLREGWEKPETDVSRWKETELPIFFAETDLKGFIGSVWFRRSFQVPEDMAKKEAKLWLGTMVDSDTVYVNGTQVGHTDYQYPPRKYVVPGELVRPGENIVVIRLKCERGWGRVTPGKRYALFNQAGEIDLRGTWKYCVGAACGEAPETDFVNWKPTGLYHGMTAPCHNYTIAAILWYQGESNTHAPETYFDLTRRLIEGYRAKWKEELPFYYVQLPNFAIDIPEGDMGWPALREQQRKALSLPGTGMVTAMDLGEDNDLHPLNKKDIGARLALLAAAGPGHKEIVCSGPVPEKVTVQEQDGILVTIALSHAQNGLYAEPVPGKAETSDDRITDFELVDGAGRHYPAKAELGGNCVLLSCPELKEWPVQVRYCYCNTPSGALVYNREGLPMSPFVWELRS